MYFHGSDNLFLKSGRKGTHCSKGIPKHQTEVPIDGLSDRNSLESRCELPSLFTWLCHSQH